MFTSPENIEGSTDESQIFQEIFCGGEHVSCRAFFNYSPLAIFFRTPSAFLSKAENKKQRRYVHHKVQVKFLVVKP